MHRTGSEDQTIFIDNTEPQQGDLDWNLLGAADKSNSLIISEYCG